MKVQRVRVQGFMRHDRLDVTIPDTGVVLVTGANGAGKSSIIEAVSTAVWGKTLRGTSPWREGQAGAAHVTTDKVAVGRDRSAAGRSTLAWAPHDAPAEAWENTQKAQAALAAVVGPWDVWRRTSVFTASDAAHFSDSSDGDRKRLLETILGLGQFDAALERCRNDLKRATATHAEARAEVSRQTGSVDVLRRWVAEAQTSLDALLADRPAPVDDPQKLRALCTAAQRDVEGVDSELWASEKALVAQRVMVAEAERHLAKCSKDRCPTCGNRVEVGSRDAAEADLAGRKAHLAALEHSRALRVMELEATRDEYREELAVLTRRLSGIEAAQRTSAKWAQEVAALRAKLATSSQEFATAQERIQAAHDKLDLAASEVALLGAVDGVLGLRGVRAHVLSAALSGVEAVANSWLSRIAGPDLRLTLRPYSEKADGSVADSISLDIAGAGGGYGYRAASTGERRRIDVALLLALSEVAAAAVGAAPGTLWVDEVFDGLDEAGVRAVVDALDALSAERAVVVITHNPAFLTALPKATHFQVR